MGNPWFRLYHQFATDPLIQALAFEDQRHYVIILCLKCEGLLDKNLPNKTKDTIICKALGLDYPTAIEVKRRLAEMTLLDDNWQPLAWDKRQFSDRHGASPQSPNGRAYIYFIGSDGGSAIKIGYSKNPWARVKDFQTGTTEKLLVVGTVATTENSEIEIHKLFDGARISGEWFKRNSEINNVINKIQDKTLKMDSDVVNYVVLLRSPTIETDTEAETELKKKVTKKKAKFTPPTIDEIDEYAMEIKANIDGNNFIDYYQARGWKLSGGNPMKDWKAAVRTWKRNGFNKQQKVTNLDGYDL